METNDEKKAVAGLEIVSSEKFAIPAERQKEFFLQEAILMDPDGCSVNRSEYEILAIFMKLIKKETSLLSIINSLEYKNSIGTLQQLIGNYLMQDSLSIAERQRMNREVIPLMKFLVEVSTGRKATVLLQGFYEKQCNLLGNILKGYAE